MNSINKFLPKMPQMAAVNVQEPPSFEARLAKILTFRDEIAAAVKELNSRLRIMVQTTTASQSAAVAHAKPVFEALTRAVKGLEEAKRCWAAWFPDQDFPTDLAELDSELEALGRELNKHRSV